MLSVEYEFTIHDIDADHGLAGVVLYPFDAPSDFYFVGVSVDEFAFTDIVVRKYEDGVLSKELTETDHLFAFEYDRVYTLRVDIVRYFSLELQVSINGYNLSYIDDDLSVGYTTHFGLKNEHCNVTGEQLSIWPVGENTNLTRPPTAAPSQHPTHMPRSEPSLPTQEPASTPSLQPSSHPTHDPSLLPTLDPSALLTSADPTNQPTMFPSVWQRESAIQEGSTFSTTRQTTIAGSVALMSEQDDGEYFSSEHLKWAVIALAIVCVCVLALCQSMEL